MNGMTLEHKTEEETITLRMGHLEACRIRAQAELKEQYKQTIEAAKCQLDGAMMAIGKLNPILAAQAILLGRKRLGMPMSPQGLDALMAAVLEYREENERYVRQEATDAGNDGAQG